MGRECCEGHPATAVVVVHKEKMNQKKCLNHFVFFLFSYFYYDYCCLLLLFFGWIFTSQGSHAERLYGTETDFQKKKKLSGTKKKRKRKTGCVCVLLCDTREEQRILVVHSASNKCNFFSTKFYKSFENKSSRMGGYRRTSHSSILLYTSIPLS